MSGCEQVVPPQRIDAASLDASPAASRKELGYGE